MEVVIESSLFRDLVIRAKHEAVKTWRKRDRKKFYSALCWIIDQHESGNNKLPLTRSELYQKVKLFLKGEVKDLYYNSFVREEGNKTFINPYEEEMVA